MYYAETILRRPVNERISKNNPVFFNVLVRDNYDLQHKAKTLKYRDTYWGVESNLLDVLCQRVLLMQVDKNRPLVERNCELFTVPDAFPVKKLRLNTMGENMGDNIHSNSMNGHRSPDCAVATLLNMGNTCFLNSVLYALRFAPTFLHNLHHLLTDISFVNGKLKDTKTKTSSLGKNASAASGTGWRSSSSKDLLSIGNSDVVPKSRDQIVAEKLHALFVTMSNLESTKECPDPHQPEALLQAVRDANSLFEGNQQQDAHELFVDLLSRLRATCVLLMRQINQNPELLKAPDSATQANSGSNSKMFGGRPSWMKQLKKMEKTSIKENVFAGDKQPTNGPTTPEADRKKIGYDFITEEFEGVSIHRTACLECEKASERKEPFLEIQVPVNIKDHEFVPNGAEDAIFGSVCVASEKLCDQNKYFCGNCNRYNEAIRTVVYEKLPNTLVLHLKRFTTSSSGVEKVNTFVPTPLEIRCFCQTCSKVEKTQMTPHKYRLSCVIMHLGTSMASGHYITFTRAVVDTVDYLDCTRTISKGHQSKDLPTNILKFIKGKALGNSATETHNGSPGLNSKNDTQVCQSIGCCGLRFKSNLKTSPYYGNWLEFDDEKVRVLPDKEFTDTLNRKHDTTNTPYLLFYSKV